MRKLTFWLVLFGVMFVVFSACSSNEAKTRIAEKTPIQTSATTSTPTATSATTSTPTATSTTTSNQRATTTPISASTPSSMKIFRCQDTNKQTEKKILEAGISELYIPQKIEGEQFSRQVLLHVPKIFDASKKYPVVFAFHGRGSSPDVFTRELWDFIEGGDFIGVYPAGHLESWNLANEPSKADDVAFVGLIIEQLCKFEQVDERFYAFGISNGSGLVHKLAAKTNYFQAVAGIVTQLYVGLQPSGPAVSVLQILGMDDQLIPYAGGSSPVGLIFLSAEDSARVWSVHNGCEEAPEVENTSEGNLRISYSNCRDGTLVTHYGIKNAGHGIPPETEGGIYTLIWNFFSSQSPKSVSGESSSMSINGYKTLYIGHSFGKPFADRLMDFVKNSEIESHSQDIVMRGGSKGAPQALWNDQETKLEIQGILNRGDIDLLIMICCSKDLIETKSDWGITNWIDYALSKNPNTKFALAMPWFSSPQNYTNAAKFADEWHHIHEEIWHSLIDDLKKRYPKTDIFCIPHGRAAVELRSRFEAGTLNDVDAMISNDGNAIFRDTTGHPDRILLDLGTLVWLGSIYDVDLSVYSSEHLENTLARYQVDLRGIAKVIVDED